MTPERMIEVREWRKRMEAGNVPYITSFKELYEIMQADEFDLASFLAGAFISLLIALAIL